VVIQGKEAIGEEAIGIQKKGDRIQNIGVRRIQ